MLQLLRCKEPVEKLLGLSALEDNLNTIEQTNAVSIVFLMKSVVLRECKWNSSLEYY